MDALQRSLQKGEIRLLHINAGTLPEITCTTSIHDLSAAPNFEALSYTWGTEQPIESVEIDGRRFPVTHNLLSALTHLRRLDGVRVVWIDAICIDQTDDEERTTSVRIMKDIYKRAAQVVVWLGTELETDKEAFELFETFDRIFKERGFFHVDQTDTTSEQAVGLPEAENSAWSSAAIFFQRPYFQRVWIIQEIVMASPATVLFGPYTVSWDLLHTVVRSIEVIGLLGFLEIEESAPGTLAIALMTALKKQIDIPLLPLLIQTRHYKSTDPRDRLFALLGIATNVKETGVVIDYILSTEEVFRNFAIHALTTQKSLLCLGSAGIHNSTHDIDTSIQPPSWIPDWRHDNSRRINIYASNCFHASGPPSPTNTPHLSISPDQQILTIRGVKIDTITHQCTHSRTFGAALGASNNFTNIHDATFQRRMKFERNLILESDIIASHAHLFPEGETLDDAYTQTLPCGLSASGKERLEKETWNGYKIWRLLINSTNGEGVVDEEKLKQGFIESGEGISFDATKWLHAGLLGSVARGVCVTEKGRLGMMGSEARAGDVVCVFQGGDVPFVLRPDGEEGGEVMYRLVGEAYVHGVMDGKAVVGEDIVFEDFRIR